jgi:hypothetical protein
MWERLKRLFTGRTRPQQAGTEADVEPDPAQSNRPSDASYVGRVAGDDIGGGEETGAERRADQP